MRCADKKMLQTGGSLKNLIAPLDDSPNADRYIFRIHKDRVYYVRLSIANLAVSIGTLSTPRPFFFPLPPCYFTRGPGYSTSVPCFGFC